MAYPVLMYKDGITMAAHSMRREDQLADMGYIRVEDLPQPEPETPKGEEGEVKGKKNESK